MAERTVIHSTFVIERAYASAPERVFAAFADPAKKRRWFVESDSHTVESYEMDFREEGKESASFRFNKQGTPVHGLTCVNEARYQNIVPNRRIVFAQTMTIGGRCISASLATVELLPSAKGTDLVFTHQAAFFEGADGPVMREAGWRHLLDKLTTELGS